MAYESTIDDLKAAIAGLESERRRIDEKLGALDVCLRYFESRQTGADQPSPQPEAPREVLTKLPRPPRRRFGIPKITEPDNNPRDAIAEILAAEGPLHRREIHDRLVSLGVPIGGQDPINNVGAHLSIDSRFENVGRGMWQLSEPGDPVDGGDSDMDGEEEDVPW